MPSDGDVVGFVDGDVAWTQVTEGGAGPLLHARTDTDTSIDITGATASTPIDVTTDFTLEVGTYIAEFSYSYDTTGTSPHLMRFRYNGTAVFTANQANPVAIGNTVVSADGSGNMIPTSNNSTAADGFSGGGSAMGRIEWKQVFKVTTGGTFKLQVGTADDEQSDTHYIYSGFTKLTKVA